MNSFVHIILLLLLPVFAQAQRDSLYVHEQQKRLDSLHLALKNATNDTIRMVVYTELARHYNVIKRDSSLYFSKLQLAISQKLHLKLDEASALNAIGYINRIFGNYPESLRFSLRALKIAEDPESEKSVWRLAKDETPREARLKVLAFVHFSLGLLYSWSGDIDKQLFHYRESEKFASEINDNGLLAGANLTLGTTYSSLNKLDSALIFEFKALDYNAKDGSNRDSGRILNAIGTIYFKKGNYALAKQYFAEAIQVSQKHATLQALGDAWVNLGNLFRETGETDSSLWYEKNALVTFRSIGSPDGLVRTYTSLSSTYRLQKNIDSAFVYQELAMAAKDSLNNATRITQLQNIGFDEQIRLRELEEEKIQIQNNIRTYSLLAGIAVFILIAFLLFRNNRISKKANSQLKKQKEELQTTLHELKNTQAQLIQSEKMASLGELTAGIAHEIQNPLNFVNNFSEVNTELLQEMKDEMQKGNLAEAKAIANDVIENQEKINHHGKRAEGIVKGMLQHSRTSTGQKELTDLNALCNEYLRLAYHGLRAKDKSFNAKFEIDLDPKLPKINVVPQDIGRVILNLINNAFYAVSEKAKGNISDYEPTVIVSTKMVGDKISFSVKDNGNGIPERIKDRIFQPFFTTKPTGQGTGLGLSLSYDIITKSHGGELKLETKDGEGTTFIIILKA
jgi:signal transduction histidine kinase